jgi:hypothetical protein
VELVAVVLAVKIKMLMAQMVLLTQVVEVVVVEEMELLMAELVEQV